MIFVRKQLIREAGEVLRNSSLLLQHNVSQEGLRLPSLHGVDDGADS